MKQIRHMCAGSSMLMLLFLVTAVTVCATIVMRSTAHAHDAARARQLSEQRRLATQGMLHYGVQLASKHFKQMVDATAPVRYTFERVMVGDGAEYTGSLVMLVHDRAITLHAQLLQNDKRVCAVSCNVHETDIVTKRGQLMVSDWHHERG